jgi:hypothetical protein
MRRRTFILLLVVATAAACAKKPGGRRGGEQTITVVAMAPDAGATLADGELPMDPSLGGRKPLPPMPGARNALPPPTDGGTGLPYAGATPPPPMPTGVEGSDAANPFEPTAPVPPVPGTNPAVPPGTELPVAPGPDAEPGLEVPGLAETPPAAPPPDTPAAAPEVFAGGEVSIRRFVLCKGIADREPVEPTSTFVRTREGQIWVYIDAGNTASQDRRITVTFEAVDRPGAAAPPVELKIAPGPRYRTWAWATAWRLAGRYRVVVRDGAGNVLARAPFEVIEE